eukprot:272099-Prymnesium_polylepis.1
MGHHFAFHGGRECPAPRAGRTPGPSSAPLVGRAQAVPGDAHSRRHRRQRPHPPRPSHHLRRRTARQGRLARPRAVESSVRTPCCHPAAGHRPCAASPSAAPAAPGRAAARRSGS